MKVKNYYDLISMSIFVIFSLSITAKLCFEMNGLALLGTGLMLGYIAGLIAFACNKKIYVN